MTTTGVDSLIAAFYEQAREFIPGGVNSATRYIGSGFAFTNPSGAYVEDLEGNRYIDYHAAFGAKLLGHGSALVTEAAAQAIQENDLIGLGTTELEVECARLLAEIIPSADRSIVTMSGTEAVSYAVRLARGVTGRRFIVKFQGCFHGWGDSVARNVISPPDLAYGFHPLSSGILRPALESTLIAEFNDLASVESLFDRFAGQIAAVILEPIPHNVGALLPEQDFLEGLRRITHTDGALLIFDEVITGFRHAVGGYQSICGVKPDLTTVGKSMGNGFPVAALCGSAHLMDHFNSAGGDVVLAGTFNGHPVSMAATIACLTFLRDTPGFYDRIFALGERMRTGLENITRELAIPAYVTGFGSVFVCYFLDGSVSGYRDLLRNHDTAYVEFHRRMTQAGHLMLPLALKRNHISGAHTTDEVDATLEQAATVLRSMAQEGIFH